MYDGIKDRAEVLYVSSTLYICATVRRCRRPCQSTIYY